MQLHAKKRLEIVIEAAALELLMDRLDRVPDLGYTVLPALAGRGDAGRWSRSGVLSRAEEMVALICVLDAAKLDAALDAAYPVIARQIGVVSVSDVEVVRAERF